MDATGTQNSRDETFLRALWRLLNEKHIFLYAAAISFTLLTTALPFILALFSVFGFVLSNEEAYTEVSRFFEALLPALQSAGVPDAITTEGMNEFLLQFIQEREQLLGVSLVIFIVIASSLYTTIRGILNLIWDVKPKAHVKHVIMARLIDIMYFGVVGSVFLLLSFLMFALGFIAQQHINLFGWQEVSLAPLFRLVALVFPVVFMFTLVLFFYRELPDDKPPLRIALVCAATFTFVWEIAKYAVGAYLINVFGRWEAIYSEVFAVLLASVIWVYYSSPLFVIAACVGHAYRITSPRF